MTGVRAGYYKEKVRFVLDFQGDVKDYYTCFALSDSPQIMVDIPYCRLTADVLKNLELKKDRLAGNVSVKRINFRRVRVFFDLKYEIPDSNIKQTVLTDKGTTRIVLDLVRNYSVTASYKLTDKLSYSVTERGSSSGYTRFAQLKVDLSSPDSPLLDIVEASGKREKVSSIRKREDAVAAVNGGFFAWGGGNLGLVSRKGVVITPDVKKRPPRTAFAFIPGTGVVIERLTVKKNDICLLSGQPLKNSLFVIGGGPRLVKNSQISVNAQEEALGPGGNDITRLAGRTSLGVDSAGNIHLFTATGYYESHAEGVKLEDIANFMVSRGVKDGMNLDGGGSSAMDLLGTIVSAGPRNDGSERPVGNAVCIYDKTKRYMPYTLANLVSDKTEFFADGKDSVTISGEIRDAFGQPVPDGTSAKIISSVGRAPFYIKTSQGKFSFNIGALKIVTPVKISLECATLRSVIWEGRSTGGSPEYFYSNIEPLQPPENGYYLEIVTEDKFGNPLSGIPLNIELLASSLMYMQTSSVTSSGGFISYTLKKDFLGGTLKVYYMDKPVWESEVIIPQ